MGPIYIKNIGTNRRKKPASIVSEIRQDRIATPKEYIFIFFIFALKKSWKVSRLVNKLDLSPRSIGNRCPFDQNIATPPPSRWCRGCRDFSFYAIFFKVAIAIH